MAHRKALGRGLGALIPGIEEGIDASLQKKLISVAIEEIRPNPLQPRKIFNQEEIGELAASIRENGIIQPLLVKKTHSGYELIAGERRWRAAQKAGLLKVPVIIQDCQEKERLELSLIENIQRKDLNVIEEAEAYRRLKEEFKYTQDELAKRLGKSRTSITNTLRLLKLHKKIKDDLLQDKITMGHARAYLGLDSTSQQYAAHINVLKKNFSVRQTEHLIQKIKKGTKPAQPPKKNIHIEALEDSLKKRFGTQIKIVQKGKHGKIMIEFYSKQDLERIIELLLGK